MEPGDNPQHLYATAEPLSAVHWCFML